MGKFVTPASLLCDFYKVNHRQQYPKGTTRVYSNWTGRLSRIEGVDKVVMFGLQAFIKEYLIDYFNEHFFARPHIEVVYEYYRYMRFTLGIENPDASHIAALHDLGYLPLRIEAVKEGTLVPIKVPMLTIENTHDDFFWLTNYVETLLSSEIWQPMTIATIALQYRKLLEDYAEQTGADKSAVIFQGHDFSMRGMGGLKVAEHANAGHLLSFVGTDTVPAIAHMESYYNANIETEMVGTSIPATEHSVMCAGGRENEGETIRRLIEDVYPKGFVSIVSDTWDLWNAIDVHYRGLKDKIMSRDGRVVIRPDSGDPVKILVGDPEATDYRARKGVIELLWDIFGGTVTEKGYKQLDSHIGVIYGDAISLDRAKRILEGLKFKGFASTNIVFGIGSFTYQYQTRDTFGFALKATYVKIDGEEHFIMKNPITDSGFKKSATGKLAVCKSHFNPHNGRITSKPEIILIDSLTEEELMNINYNDHNMLEDVFVDGKLVRDQSLAEIRALLESQL